MITWVLTWVFHYRNEIYHYRTFCFLFPQFASTQFFEVGILRSFNQNLSFFSCIHTNISKYETFLLLWNSHFHAVEFWLVLCILFFHFILILFVTGRVQRISSRWQRIYGESNVLDNDLHPSSANFFSDGST